MRINTTHIALTLVIVSFLGGCAHLRGARGKTSYYDAGDASYAAFDTSSSVDTSWVDAQRAADARQAADAQQQVVAQQQADQAQAAWQQSMDATLAAQAAAVAEFQ